MTTHYIYNEDSSCATKYMQTSNELTEAVKADKIQLHMWRTGRILFFFGKTRPVTRH